MSDYAVAQTQLYDSITRMESFKVVMDSLGHYSVDMIPGVSAVRLFPDETNRTIHMEICLRADTWSNRERAIDAVIEIREMFIDDLALTYAFGELHDDELALAEGVPSLVYAN